MSETQKMLPYEWLIQLPDALSLQPTNYNQVIWLSCMKDSHMWVSCLISYHSRDTRPTQTKLCSYRRRLMKQGLNTAVDNQEQSSLIKLQYLWVSETQTEETWNEAQSHTVPQSEKNGTNCAVSPLPEKVVVSSSQRPSLLNTLTLIHIVVSLLNLALFTF